jgi:signal transduction histidine kinase
MVKARLLVIDDEQTLLSLFERRLERLSYQVYSANSGAKALEILEEHEVDVLITDFQMPGMDGCEIITRALQMYPLLQSIMVTGYSDVKTAIDAMGAGAFNYLQKPIDFAELDVVIEKGLEKRRLLQDVQNKQKQLEEYRNHLEEIVEKRTIALTEANRQLKKEIEERKSLEISLREAKVAAENANRAKSEFLANMSHEIRTPMTSAIGLLNLVLDTELLPKQKAYLEMARISTVVMHNLLNDILDFSKIEAGRLTLETIPFSPAKVVESVIDLQHLQAEEKTIRLTCDIADDVPDAVVGDPNRLRQVILNLVANGIKFTQYGEVVLTCRRVGSDVGENQHVVLHFSIRDTGIGINSDKIAVIFEAFTQADSTTTRRFGGVGLGLNICSRLVAMMGGRIWVESKPGCGSTFHFTCRLSTNLTREERGQLAATVEADAGPERESEAGTVLVVEDDRTNQWVIGEILEHEGFTVIGAADGSTALRELDKQCFDLMLLDLMLPDMDGYQVVGQIRQRQYTACDGTSLPVIALTGMAGEDEKQRCLNAGMNDFLAKPFAVAQLSAKLQQYSRKKVSGRQPPARKHRRGAPDPSILSGEIFNEQDALIRASGNRELLGERITALLRTAPDILESLRRAIANDEDIGVCEQEVHSLKQKAMEAGGTRFADELFSLLMQLRKKQNIGDVDDRMDGLAAEFACFCREPRVRQMAREKTEQNQTTREDENVGRQEIETQDPRS